MNCDRTEHFEVDHDLAGDWNHDEMTITDLENHLQSRLATEDIRSKDLQNVQCIAQIVGQSTILRQFLLTVINIRRWYSHISLPCTSF